VKGIGDPAGSGAGSGAGSSAGRKRADVRAHGREHAGSAASEGAVDQSRLPKGASALRSRSRRSADELRYSLARRLTDRDRAIVRAVERHRVLTTEQLAAVFFDSERRAQVRLVRLFETEILARFEPHRASWGRHRYHYVVGPLGAALLAAERGDDPDRAARRWKGERVLLLGRTQRLAHLVGVNDLYAALAGKARRDASCRLRDWLTEADCARWTEGIVRPDAWGVWEEAGLSVEYFLEYDRGTETLGRLVVKLDVYERFEAERGVTAWVLFAFLSPRREQRARAALAGATVPLATAVVGHVCPHDAVWRPLGDERPLRLAQLADVPKPPEAVRRAASNAVRAWRFDRSRPDDEEEAPIETP
jgi:hypothetical protein